MRVDDRYILPLAFGLAPAALLIATWSDNITPASELAKKHALSVVAVEIAVIVAALRSGWRPKLERQPAVGVLALGAIAWTTAYAAPLQLVSLMWTGYWSIHLLFGMAVAQLFDPRVATRSMFVGFAIFICLFAVRVGVGPVENWQQNPPGFDQIRRLGYYGAAISALAIGSLAVPRGKIVPFVILTAAIALIFWSGSRGAALAAIIGPLALAAIEPRMRQWNLLGLALGGFALGYVLAALAPTPDMVFMGAERAASVGFSSSGRLELWQDIIRAIAERPFFGWGEAQTKVFGSGLVQPHNLFLQILLAWGFIGLSWTSYLALLAAKRAIPNISAGGALLPPGVAISTMLAYAMIDGTLFHVHAASVFFMCTGLLLAGRDLAPATLKASNSA